MNKQLLEYSKNDLEKRIADFIIKECMGFAASYPAHIGTVNARVTMNGFDIVDSEVTVTIDG